MMQIRESLMRTRAHLTQISAFLFSLILVPICNSQEYPVKTVRYILPAASGGASDTLARKLAQKMSEAFGKPVIVDNRPGAGTVIGTALVAKASPDGHTLVQVTTNFVVNPALVKNLPYDSVRDFAPVALLAAGPLVLVVNPTVPAKSVAEFIALAKAQPDLLNYASSGVGTASHLAGALLSSSLGIKLTHVSYNGAAPAVLDLIGGRVQAMFSSIPSVMNQIRGEKLRVLAITSSRRIALMSAVPTLAEAGVPGYDVTQTFGVLTTARTPASVISKLNVQLNRGLESPEVVEYLHTEGIEAVGGRPEIYSDYINREIPKWVKLVSQAGIRIE